jgi:hypothetical protein
VVVVAFVAAVGVVVAGIAEIAVGAVADIVGVVVAVGVVVTVGAVAVVVAVAVAEAVAVAVDVVGYQPILVTFLKNMILAKSNRFDCWADNFGLAIADIPDASLGFWVHSLYSVDC